MFKSSFLAAAEQAQDASYMVATQAQGRANTTEAALAQLQTVACGSVYERVFTRGSCLKELGVPEDSPTWAKAAPAPEFPPSPVPYSPMIMPGFNEEEYQKRPDEDEDALDRTPNPVMTSSNEVPVLWNLPHLCPLLDSCKEHKGIILEVELRALVRLDSLSLDFGRVYLGKTCGSGLEVPSQLSCPFLDSCQEHKGIILEDELRALVRLGSISLDFGRVYLGKTCELGLRAPSQLGCPLFDSCQEHKGIIFVVELRAPVHLTCQCPHQISPECDRVPFLGARGGDVRHSCLFIDEGSIAVNAHNIASRKCHVSFTCEWLDADWWLLPPFEHLPVAYPCAQELSAHEGPPCEFRDYLNE
ncbi:hypothetical protein Acr_27g0006860 [Actinidia rufa]|uniref:Uncharacterized protein n=1 Tax=Actinidia rufa TaxID=165716 RepID=A0A7J0H757_9ERIC|nr:hypothetical protein Acr_27g0006860 [Actinidia rufa]